jgi:hypothetical protein
METNAFLRQYTSEDEILKYTRATAGSGINIPFNLGLREVFFRNCNS